MNLMTPILAMLALGFAPDETKKPTETVIYKGAIIHTANAIPIINGYLVVKDGKIIALGSAENMPAIQGKIIDVTGKVIIPGLVDSHSHLGVFARPQVPANSDGNEGSGPLQASLRALDGITPNDPGIRMALAGGVTTANIMPGSGNVIGGQTLYVKFVGQTVEQMRIQNIPVLGGLKMANGENPKRFNFDRTKSAPATRMKIHAMQREQFIKAREYQKKWADYRKKKETDAKAEPPEVDLALEPLVEVLERKRTVHFHCHRADDIYSAFKLSQEFDFEIVLQHATEAYRIVDELAKKNAWVSLTLVDSPGGKAEVSGLLEENAAAITKAGVKVAINTDDPVTESRFFLRTGAIALRGGMTELEALRALTLNPATMMHLEKRVGSLEVGKDADFVVLSGAPFSIYTQVLATFIEGKQLFDRTVHENWAYQAGGFALVDRENKLPKVPAVVSSMPKVIGIDLGNLKAPMSETPERLAIFAGRIHTVSGKPILEGVVLLEKGRITAVGKVGEVKIPPGTPALAVAEVTPGLIDAHSSVGLSGALNIQADQDQDENTDPNQADLRVIDGFNPDEALLEFLRRQGVTVLHVVPGAVNVIAGQTGILKTYGNTVDAMTIKFPAALMINLGEIPKKTYPNKAPTTRMATAALLRNEFNKGNEQLRKRLKETDGSKLEPKPKLDPFADAVSGKLPVIFSAHRADDIQTALRITSEFNLKAQLDQATEAYLMIDEIRKAGIPIVLHPTMQRVARMETFNTFVGSAQRISDAQIPVAISSGFEDYVPKTRSIRFEAAMAMAHGFGFDKALGSITLEAAKILGIDKDYGSIEMGKVADLVLYDGDPFEHSTQVKYTIIGGRIVYNRDDYLKMPFARRALPFLGSGAGSGGCCIGW
ncbi:MAG: amidohydrolase [Planctomycetota bacterium]|nr:MAG: amidohydrolase [Planctomycetota bacterium]